jgi:DNA primase
LERGLAAYDDVKKSSCSAMAFACQSLLPQAATASAEQKSRAATALYEIIAQTDSDVTRMSFLSEIAQNLRVPQAALERDLRAYLLRGSGSRFAPAHSAPTPTVNLSAGPSTKAAEAHLLFLCLHHDSLLHAFARELPHEWIDQSQPAGLLLDRILAEAAHNGWAGREQLDQILETEEEKSLIASLLFEVAGDDDLAKMANEGLRSMQRRFLEPKVRQIELEIATKGADLDSQLPSLLKQRAEIIRQLQHPPKLTLDS